ncbi:hypothetical protein QJQ45_000964 [Haematococcus lacustris]|nr:hypothetical protein QJQ45_000964 [Haematococcus lacustris]
MARDLEVQFKRMYGNVQAPQLLAATEGDVEHVDAEQLEIEERLTDSTLRPNPRGMGVQLRAYWNATVQQEVELRFNKEAASVSQLEWGTRKQLVVFFGNAGIGTRGGWGAKAVLQACRKVVERPNNGKPTDRVSGGVVTVDEFRTSRVSSILNSPQPCEEELDSSKPTRPEDWKPKP